MLEGILYESCSDMLKSRIKTNIINVIIQFNMNKRKLKNIKTAGIDGIRIKFYKDIIFLWNSYMD